MKRYLYRYRFDHEEFPENYNSFEISQCYKDFDVSKDYFTKLTKSKEELLKQFHSEIQSLRQKLDEKADKINKNIDSSKKEIMDHGQATNDQLANLSNVNTEKVIAHIVDLKENLSHKKSKYVL